MEEINELVSTFTPIELSGDNVFGFSSDPYEFLGIQNDNVEESNDQLFDKLLNYTKSKNNNDNLKFILPTFKQSSVPVKAVSSTNTSYSNSRSSKSDIDLSLPEILKEEGVHFKITSGYRGSNSFRGGKTKQGRRSNHNRLDNKGNPLAYDIVPDGVSWTQLKKEIYGNPRILNYLLNRNWGIIDETKADIKKITGATGDHLHIGADSLGRRMLSSQIQKQGLLKGQEGFKVPAVDLVSQFSVNIPRFNEDIYKIEDDDIERKNKLLFDDIYNYTPSIKEETTSEEDLLKQSPFYYRPEEQKQQTITYIPQQTTTQPTSISGNSTPSKIMNYFLSKGMPKHIAAGIMGNLYVESKFNPSAIGDRGTSGGIAQWHGNRFTQLKMFAKRRNKDWRDLYTQLDFLLYELNSSYKHVYDQIKNVKDSDSVVNILGHDFERFAGYKNFNNSNYKLRRKYAKYFNNLWED